MILGELQNMMLLQESEKVIITGDVMQKMKIL